MSFDYFDDKFEQDFFRKLRRKYSDTRYSRGLDATYDIYIPETNTKIECKNDEKSEETGNLVIEYECFGKPSGISITTADYWVIRLFLDGWKYTTITPEDIKETCHFLGKEVTGGERNASKMHLLTVEDIALHQKAITKPHVWG